MIKKVADTLKLTKKFWADVGNKIAVWVQRDTSKGIFQNDTQGLHYLSSQYTDYKSRGFAAKSRPGKIKPYYAVSTDRTTSFVNMMVTGELMKSLKVKDSTELGVTMKYGHGGKYGLNLNKIEGNRIYGREVMGLNTENQKKVKAEIEKAVDKNLRRWAKEEIKINVGW